MGRDTPCRGSDTCGDIDVIITRPVEDGKTHSGGYLYVAQGSSYGSWDCDLLSMDEQVLRRNYGRRATHGESLLKISSCLMIGAILS